MFNFESTGFVDLFTNLLQFCKKRLSSLCVFYGADQVQKIYLVCSSLFLIIVNRFLELQQKTFEKNIHVITFELERFKQSLYHRSVTENGRLKIRIRIILEKFPKLESAK